MTQRNFNNPLGSITSILLLVLFFLGLFYIARAMFWVLSAIAPILLIITLFLDHKVVVNYGKWLVNSVKRNPVFGIAMILLTVFGFPVVAGFLFSKALLKRKIKTVKEEMQTHQSGDFIEYEDVETTRSTTLELPDWREEKRKRPIREKRNEYDDLFGE